MTPAETIAITKAINGEAKAAREALKPGKHDVDVTVRIQGTLSVSEDTEKKPTTSIPFKTAFALLAHVAGCTGKAGLGKIEEAMRLALEDGEDAKLILKEAAPKVADIEARIIGPMLARLPKTPVKGGVRADLSVEVVNAVDCGCGEVAVA